MKVIKLVRTTHVTLTLPDDHPFADRKTLSENLDDAILEGEIESDTVRIAKITTIEQD